MDTISLLHIRQSLPLLSQTPPSWVDVVMGDLNGFLADHASCERKAHAAAMMMVTRFPEYPVLQDTMISLAIEELQHFQQVFRLLRERGMHLGLDEVDCYVKELMKHVRHPREDHLLDRLLAAAVVEARSCERFCLLVDALPAGYLKTFYLEFSMAESRHVPLFVDTAKLIFGEDKTKTALDRWLTLESEIMLSLPLRAGVH